MITKSITSTASKAGTTALALCLMAANTAAFARCASREEMTALRVAALRQQLMVAALTCHEASSFNRFVTSYRDEFLVSDRALLRFFARENGSRADDAYNSYKTKMANDSSLRSLSDPWFCGRAKSAFSAALTRNPPLAELVADQSRPIETGFSSCLADDSTVVGTPVSAPVLPSRHRYMLEGTPASSDSTAAGLSSVPEREASVDAKPIVSPPAATANGPAAAPPVNVAGPAQDGDQANAAPEGSYRDAYNAASAPYAYAPPPRAYNAYARWWYAGQRPMQQVQGQDGRWYLVPSDGR